MYIIEVGKHHNLNSIGLYWIMKIVKINTIKIMLILPLLDYYCLGQLNSYYKSAEKLAEVPMFKSHSWGTLESEKIILIWHCCSLNTREKHYAQNGKLRWTLLTHTCNKFKQMFPQYSQHLGLLLCFYCIHFLLA